MENEEKSLIIEVYKQGAQEELSESFVENFELWKKRMGGINDLIYNVSPDVEPYNFNEYCKKIREITDSCLESKVDYDSLFLTEVEYNKIEEDAVGNFEKIKELGQKLLDEKYLDGVTLILNKEQFLGVVEYKLGEKFSEVKDDLNASLDLVNIFRKYRDED